MSDEETPVEIVPAPLVEVPELTRWQRRAEAQRKAELAGRPWREEEWERQEAERERREGQP